MVVYGSAVLRVYASLNACMAVVVVL